MWTRSKTTTTTPTRRLSTSLHLGLLLCLVVVAAIVMVVAVPQTSALRRPTTQNDTQQQQQKQRHLLLKTVDDMATDFEFAKSKLLQRLRNDYGNDLFDTLWMEPDATKCGTVDGPCTIARPTFLQGSHNAAVSWHKTVRKMKINLLQHLTTKEPQDFVWATAYVIILN